ncbi:MAG: hypothetical protein NUW37_00780 [Planctomycetes bacterium]|nr:hypothetical protein [Planctomycetota bacterium]
MTDSIRSFVLSDSCTLSELRAQFDAATFEQQVSMMYNLGGYDVQKKIYELAAASEPLTRTQLIPDDYPEAKTVRFVGKNSMALFTTFEKRMCRTQIEGGSGIIGYNHTGWRPLMTIVGPGYFIARDCESEWGSACVDYNKVPEHAPHTWPRIIGNEKRLSRFVYNRTIDYLRRVSKDLVIGLATRDGSALPNYFLLVREPLQ